MKDTTYIVWVSVCHCASFKRKKRVARKGNKTRRSRQRSGRKSEHLEQQGGEQVVEQENTQGCLKYNYRLSKRSSTFTMSSSTSYAHLSLILEPNDPVLPCIALTDPLTDSTDLTGEGGRCDCVTDVGLRLGIEAGTFGLKCWE